MPLGEVTKKTKSDLQGALRRERLDWLLRRPFGLLRDAFPGMPLGEITKKNKKQLRCHFVVCRVVSVSKLPHTPSNNKSHLCRWLFVFLCRGDWIRRSGLSRPRWITIENKGVARNTINPATTYSRIPVSPDADRTRSVGGFCFHCGGCWHTTAEKTKTAELKSSAVCICRGDWIRTSDLQLPKLAR